MWQCGTPYLEKPLIFGFGVIALCMAMFLASMSEMPICNFEEYNGIMEIDQLYDKSKRQILDVWAEDHANLHFHQKVCLFISLSLKLLLPYNIVLWGPRVGKS